MPTDHQSTPTDVIAQAIANTPSPLSVQGFHYPPYYVVRDVSLPREQQELWRGPDNDQPAYLAAFAFHSAMPAARAAVAALVAAGFYHGDRP